ncbi:MAG: peptidoglycan-binding protein [Mojavia pulchra JT2-VF2]|jgi:peptidoglycan hydrolase-like protein with peptidoglycan-binding domain|uniref:Peptidoglycan-binding protein n=1 Tax=Mojavia pulchra JT2-VF2 TaxID=287848 RepID=A0A951UE99_9NOST|nr:peptidoglycan-binding protein [Mojavia pulchra JT2-VF2]
MGTIGYLHLTLAYKPTESLEVVPVQVNFRFLNWIKLSSAFGMRFLSVALTMTLLSVAGQTLALEKVGSNGTEVANIQRCLKKIGYFRGPVNGQFGPLTQQAVTAFQQAKRLPADGVVGNSTQSALQQACQTRTSTNVRSHLQLGSRGPEVIRLQQRLQQLGYFNGPITGYFGPQTQQALIRSQQSSRSRTNTVVPARTRQATLNANQGGEYPTLSEGSKGAAVTRLQQRLQQLGYFNTTATGNFGRITSDAVIAFQRNSGIPANGIVNRQTWNRLLGYSQTKIPATSSIPTQQVRELQEYLADLGYLKTNPTGNFGPMTRDALIRFQRDYQLAVDGVADAQALQAVRSVWQNRYANNPQVQVAQSPTIQVAQSPRNYLTIGDRGENVKAIQERLLQLGFFNANPDGYFGENTRAYVYAFQQYSRLNPTGVVDAQTWQALGLNSSAVDNSAINNNNRYVVVVPIHNAETLNKVRQYIPNPVVETSSLGDYVNAGRFGDRAEAEKVSKMLRSYGLDARVEYF